MTESKNRVVWIDIVKFFCIFFVMISHLGGGFIAPELNRFYVTFYLTGFFFASGYTYKHRIGFKQHVIKKIKQLLVPWVLFSLANISLSQFLSFHPEWHPGFWTEVQRNLAQIRELGDGSMWFANALFVAYIPFYFLIDHYLKQKKNDDTVYIRYIIVCFVMIILYETYTLFVPGELFPWGSNALPWHLEYIVFMDAFMYLGYITKERCEKTIDSLSFVATTLIYIAIVAIPLLVGMDLKNRWFALPYNVISQLFGTLFIVLLSKKITANRIMLFCGRNTLAYYGMHGKFLAVCEAIVKKISLSAYETICANSFLAAMYSFAMGIVFVFGLIIPVMIVNKYLPFMVGKSRS